MAAQPPFASAWPERRRRRQEARAALTGKLQAALARVCALEEELAAVRAAAAVDHPGPRAQEECPQDAAVQKEMEERLVLVAPVIREVVAGGPVKALQRIRRNAASHLAGFAARAIAVASRPQLNRWQRQSRDPESPGEPRRALEAGCQC